MMFAGDFRHNLVRLSGMEHITDILRDTMPMDMQQLLRILTCIMQIMRLDMEITNKHSRYLNFLVYFR